MTGAQASAARRATLVLSVSALCLAAPGVRGQETGGLTAQLTVSEQLRYSDTRGADRFSSVTRLGFALTSRTRTQALSFDIGSGLDYTITGEDGLEDAEGVSDFFEPRLSLAYSRESRATLLEASASYRQEEIFGFIPEQGFLTIELIPATGLLQETTADVALTFGRDAPFSGQLRYGLRDLGYSDVINVGIFDARTQTAAAELDFRITPRITASLDLSRELYEAEDAERTDRTEDRVALGVDLEVNPVLSLGAALDYDRRETETLAGSAVTEGFGLDLSARLARPNGDLTARLSSDVTPSGQRSTLRFGRSYALRDDASFSFSLGATKTDDLPLSLLAGLTFERELERGTVTLSLDQQARTDNEDRQVVSTQASVAITRPVNSRQGFGASFSLANTNVLDEDSTADRTRADLSLTYDYQLGARWNLNTGVTHTRFFGDDIDDDARSTVFVGISRAFTYRP